MGLPTPPRKRPMAGLPGQSVADLAVLPHLRMPFPGPRSPFSGSGYAWLVARPGGLFICTTANQKTPADFPLLVLNVWEHVYYLKHYNLRAAYIKDWFRILNWERAEMIILDFLSACPSSF